MNPKTIDLTRELLDAIIEHCRHGYPHEACGLVSGKRGRVEQVYRLTNVAPQPLNNYVIDPMEQLAAFQEMHASGRDLVAIFHSHPASPASPSERDIDLAFYPYALHIIVSMAVDPPDVRAFDIDRTTRAVRSAPIRVRDE